SCRRSMTPLAQGALYPARGWADCVKRQSFEKVITHTNRAKGSGQVGGRHVQHDALQRGYAGVAGTVYEIAPLPRSRKSAAGSTGMAGIAGVAMPGLPHHVTQRGNRREPVFFEADDYRLYRRLVTTAPRRGSSLGLLPDAQSRPPANHAHLA